MTRPPRQIRSLGAMKREVERMAPLVQPDVRAGGTAEGITAPTGSSSAQPVVPDRTVEKISGLIADRRLEGGGAITDDTQVIPGGTRVEYKVKMFRKGRTTSEWLFASNDAMCGAPRFAAPINGECELSRWPQRDGTMKLVLQLIAVETGSFEPCPAPAT